MIEPGDHQKFVRYKENISKYRTFQRYTHRLTKLFNSGEYLNRFVTRRKTFVAILEKHYRTNKS